MTVINLADGTSRNIDIGGAGNFRASQNGRYLAFTFVDFGGNAKYILIDTEGVAGDRVGTLGDGERQVTNTSVVAGPDGNLFGDRQRIRDAQHSVALQDQSDDGRGY